MMENYLLCYTLCKDFAYVRIVHVEKWGSEVTSAAICKDSNVLHAIGGVDTTK